jgi:hypothetical protein
MILVDTSVLIDVLKGVKNAHTAKFRSVVHQEIPFAITSIIFQEILQGAKSDAEYKRLEKYFKTQRFYHPKHPIESFSSAARMYMACRRQGITIRSTVDCLIAQIALEHGLFLFHNDSDFDAMKTVIPLRCF